MSYCNLLKQHKLSAPYSVKVQTRGLKFLVKWTPQGRLIIIVFKLTLAGTMSRAIPMTAPDGLVRRLDHWVLIQAGRSSNIGTIKDFSVINNP